LGRSYVDEVVGICSVESIYSHRGRQSLLALELFVQASAKVLLHAQCLKYENAHPHYTLLRRIAFILHSIEQYLDYKVVRPIGIYEKGSEMLVALCYFPEEHNHLGYAC